MQADRGSAVRTLIGVSGGFFGGAGVAAIWGVLLSVSDYDPGAAGWLLAAPALTGSLLRIPTAARADQVGARRIFSGLGWAGVAGLALTSVAAWSGAPVWVMLWLGVLSGAGMATFAVGAAQLTWSSPPARAGLMVGLYGGFANLGPTLALLLLPLLKPHMEMVWLPLVWAGVSALGMLGYTWLAKEPERAPERAEASEVSAPPGMGASTWWLTLAYFASYGAFVALCGWLPWLWEQSGEGAERALWFVLLAPLARMPAGWLSDHHGGMGVMVVGGVIGAVSAGALAANLGWLWQLPLALGLGAMMGATFALVPRYSPRQVGRVAGLVGGLGATGGFALPPLLVALVRPGYPAWGMVSVVALLALTVLGAAWIGRPPRDAAAQLR